MNAVSSPSHDPVWHTFRVYEKALGDNVGVSVHNAAVIHRINFDPPNPVLSLRLRISRGSRGGWG